MLLLLANLEMLFVLPDHQVIMLEFLDKLTMLMTNAMKRRIQMDFAS